MTYFRILRRRGIAVLVLSTLLARLPVGINGLAVLLYVEDQRGSFAVAGAVAGAMALGTAVGGPLQGRLVDWRGTRILIPLACLHAAGLVAIVLLAGSDLPTLAIAAIALLSGCALPPSTSVLRSYWPHLLRGDEHLITAAYALDSVLIEAVFVAGPLATAAAIATTGTAGALYVSGACTVVGTAAFAVVLARHPGPDGGRRSRLGGLGALDSAGLRTLILASFPLGFYLGSIEVCLPAYSEQAGTPAMAGVLFAVFSVSSAGAGLVYGVLRLRAPLHLVHLRLTHLLPLACLPLAFAWSGVSVGLLAIVAGLPVAPIVASRNELVVNLAPPGAATEAFSWPLTSMIVGISAGAGAGGWLVDEHDWSAPLIAGALVAGLGAVLLSMQRSRLEPRPA